MEKIADDRFTEHNQTGAYSDTWYFSFNRLHDFCHVYSLYTQTCGCKEAVTMFIAQIDKKAASRSRDNLVPFTDVLASLKPSEFTDFQLARYKVLTSQQTCLLSLWQK